MNEEEKIAFIAETEARIRREIRAEMGLPPEVKQAYQITNELTRQEYLAGLEEKRQAKAAEENKLRQEAAKAKREELFNLELEKFVARGGDVAEFGPKYWPKILERHLTGESEVQIETVQSKLIKAGIYNHL